MLTLRNFLRLNHGAPVEVCVKEPNKCFKYKTTLINGVSNMHTDNDLDRAVYSIGVTHNKGFNGNILHVYCW